jgi:hypothetical protein
MAQIVLTDVTVSLGSITIGTNAVKSVTINYTPEVLDNTGMGHGAKSRKVGLPDWSIDIEIFQDYADDALDEDLWAIIAGTGDVGAISIKPTSSAISAANPAYTSTAGFLESYSPIAAGAVGELGLARLRILSMGADLDRDITP